ncbi:MAG TPA: FtsX-like permease family protein [Candidatus Lumbricidophila sp.]|nr:FtsX-like permease family protein [Candidatus Lumbricidophila sp.]
MSLARQLKLLVIEALASSRAQPVASLVATLIVAGMCAAVFLTTGRTVGAEQAVLSRIDDEGTRAIVVRADAGAGLDASVVTRIQNIEGIEWAGAFGFPRDVTNSAIGPGGEKVALRPLWTSAPAELGIPATFATFGANTAWASTDALATLGMRQGAGGVQAQDGLGYGVLGALRIPSFLADMTPTLLAPEATFSGRVATLIVVARDPSLVGPVGKAVGGLLDAEDSSKVTITTSEALAQLREAIRGQLGSYGRQLVILIFGVSAALVAAVQYGLVSMRRKDFGRRRALGATRSLIVGLVLFQVAIVSAIGSAAGALVATVALLLSKDPLPPWEFFVGVDLLAVAVATLAALWPAVFASRRDPARELRVP